MTPDAGWLLADLFREGPLLHRLAAVALYVAAAAVALALLVRRPPVTRWTVLATAPWALAAAALGAYATVAAYPAVVRPLFEAPHAYLATFTFAGFAWLAMLEFEPPRRAAWDPSIPLATMGVGMASVLIAGAVASGRATDLGRLSLLPIVLVAAAAVAGAVFLAFGVLYTDVPAYTGLAGGLVLFGHAFDGVATAIGVSAFPWIGHTRLSTAAVDLAVALPLAEHLGTGGALEWIFLLLWFKLAFAVLVVAALARYARERPSRANVALGGMALAGVVPGATTLLLVLTGG